MDLNLVINQLRTYAPSFGGSRVAGAAQFKLVSENTNLPTPCCYVIPLGDQPEASMSQNSVRQKLTDSFAVVVCIDNAADERGQASAISVETIKRELWKALLGWRSTLEYNGIAYEGGSLQSLNRAQLWHQFEFGADMDIGPEDGWEEGALERLPNFNTAHFNVDVIEPIAQPAPGPDGRVEFQVHLTNLNPPI